MRISKNSPLADNSVSNVDISAVVRSIEPAVNVPVVIKVSPSIHLPVDVSYCSSALFAGDVIVTSVEPLNELVLHVALFAVI